MLHRGPALGGDTGQVDAVPGAREVQLPVGQRIAITGRGRLPPRVIGRRAGFNLKRTGRLAEQLMEISALHTVNVAASTKEDNPKSWQF